MRKRKQRNGYVIANCVLKLEQISGLMDSIKSIQPPGKWKIIVVDSKSIQILNAACKMYDILEENVKRKKKATKWASFTFFCANFSC